MLFDKEQIYGLLEVQFIHLQVFDGDFMESMGGGGGGGGG